MGGGHACQIYGIEKYLGSGLVKGIGPVYAKAIVSRFGLETIDIIENDIERLLEVPRLGRKRMEKIRESWERQKDIKEVMVLPSGLWCQHGLRRQDLSPVSEGRNQDCQGESL